MTRFLVFMLLLLALPSCASVFGDATQEISVLTPGAHESECMIDNGEVVYRTRPPQEITISRRNNALKITCLADGNRERTVIVESEPEPVALANVANGFLPGMIVDQQTGSLYTFPKLVTVDFTNMPAEHMPRPDYDQYLADNPSLFGMEEFRPGDAALSRDKYEPDYVLQPRKHPGKSEFISPVVTGMDKPAVSAETTDTAASSAEDLTKSMNPEVFDPTTSDQVPAPPSSPHSGGPGHREPSSSSEGAPVPLSPANQ